MLVEEQEPIQVLQEGRGVTVDFGDIPVDEPLDMAFAVTSCSL